MLPFILAVLAGFATPFVEPALTKLVQPRLSDVPMHEGEYLTITFVLLLIAVAVVSIVSGVLTSAFTVLLGGALGLFGVRLLRALKALVDGQNIDQDDA